MVDQNGLYSQEMIHMRPLQFNLLFNGQHQINCTASRGKKDNFTDIMLGTFEFCTVFLILY